MPNPTQAIGRGLIIPVHQGMNAHKPGHKVIERAGLVEETSLIWNHEFWYSGDRWRQHDLSGSHRLHEYQRNAFALAGEHDDVGPVVKRIHLLGRNVSEQSDLLIEAVLVDHFLQPSALGSVAGNQAFKVDSTIAQADAGPHQ